jgi:hypothetical protein
MLSPVGDITRCGRGLLPPEIAAREHKPVMTRATAAEMRQRVDGPPPEEGTPFQEVLERVFADVLPHRARIDSGGYQAFIPGYATWPSAMADLVASSLILDACWWLGAAGSGSSS